MNELDQELGDARPWELPGALRRDCEPHRGKLLLWLGVVGAGCSLLAFCLCVPGLVGIAIGLPVWVVAAQDLNKMRGGVMDHAGRAQTEEALILGRMAVVLGFALMVLFPAVLWTRLLPFGR
jgi:hypothetical protein